MIYGGMGMISTSEGTLYSIVGIAGLIKRRMGYTRQGLQPRSASYVRRLNTADNEAGRRMEYARK